MWLRDLKTLLFILEENLSPRTLARCPEPTSEMNDARQVQHFHEEKALASIYQMNARAIHALARKGAVIFDLGCGSGQMLAHLAQVRTDLQIFGIDISPKMIALGQESLKKANLDQRVNLCHGDMTNFLSLLPPKVDLITSIFSLHHLPQAQDLQLCVDGIFKAVEQKKAGVWIFDHTRPKKLSSAQRFPDIFTPHSPLTFKTDSQNSLMAAWTFDELTKVLEENHPPKMIHSLAFPLATYQIHWLRSPQTITSTLAEWHELNLPVHAQKDARALQRLFRCFPGHS